MSALADELKHQRARLRMSQSEAAAASGVSYRSLAGWETGRGDNSVHAWRCVEHLQALPTPAEAPPAGAQHCTP